MNKPSGKLAFAYATIANLEEKIARLESAQPEPVAVVLPERRDLPPSGPAFYARGWNACLDEVTRLNTKE